MKFTDIFITRPVLASVVSLVILVLGLRALAALPVQQYPHTESGVVTVTTSYYGADPDVVAGFITTPLENAVAQANGIDYITSTSRSGLSIITINLRLNYDSNKALTEISTKVSSVLNSLPPQSQQPVLAVSAGMATAALYIGFSSDVLPRNKITDYLVRVVQPKLQAVEGVQKAEILGGQNFALRAWLDPQKLAAYGLTASDVTARMAANDYISGIGSTKGQMTETTLTASTGVHTVEEFEKLVIKQDGDAFVRLRDIAKVSLGAEDYETNFAFDGKDSVVIGINIAPSANLLDVISGVRKVFPEIHAQLPAGLNGEIVYDTTDFVNASIREVIRTLAEALVIVTLVIFAFMGSPRAVFIPIIAMPLSLVGCLAMMLLFGFSINLLTLLALVLAIGLVVDDAIIVVENISRHLEEGMTPMDAAITAARELGGPIVAMTIVLVAVYVPVGFQGGLTGTLFKEFALTLVGAVTISAIVALTLSPMMGSRLLRPHNAPNTSGWEKRVVTYIDHKFDQLRHRYQRVLHESLRTVSVAMTFALIVLGSIYYLYTTSGSELAPVEDQGFVLGFSTAATNSTLQQRLLYSAQLRDLAKKHEEITHTFQIEMPGQSIAGHVLKPWDDRAMSAQKLMPLLQQEYAEIAGAQIAVFPPPSLPGTQGLPVQFVISTTQPYGQLNDVANTFLQDALKSGMFIFLNSDLKINKPQSTIDIDRDKAAQLGLTMSDVGNAMASMVGGGYVNYFSLSGRSYKVMPQVAQDQRLNVDQMLDYHIRTPSGASVPLSTVATISNATVPDSINHFQQLSAATVQGVPMPGVTLGAAIEKLQELSKTLPTGYFVDYGGPTRQYVKESSGFVVTFGFALIIIYLALAALFESFRDPIIILISVPMSIAGALIFINLGVGGATLNIYTEVGLVTLMGLISKHGILIVEFANELQKAGKSKLEAIEEAASIRLRPILMTTFAMVFGVFPLIIATGAGAASRFAMGLVIASGISIGTLFTIFVVPAVYMVLATDHSRKVAQDLAEAVPTSSHLH